MKAAANPREHGVALRMPTVFDNPLAVIGDDIAPSSDGPKDIIHVSSCFDRCKIVTNLVCLTKSACPIEELILDRALYFPSSDRSSATSVHSLYRPCGEGIPYELGLEANISSLRFFREVLRGKVFLY